MTSDLKKKKKVCLRITRWLFPWSMHWLIPRWKVLSIHGRIILWNINQFSFLPTSFLFPISFFQASLFYTHYLKKQWHRWSLECFSGFWISKVLSSSEKNLKIDLFLGALEANAYKHDFHKNTYFEFQTANLQMKFCKWDYKSKLELFFCSNGRGLW